MLLSWFLSSVLGIVYCCIVFVLLNAMFVLVCLKKTVSFLIFGIWYVKIASFVFVFILFLVDFLLHLYFQICYEFLREVVVLCHGLYCLPFYFLVFLLLVGVIAFW